MLKYNKINTNKITEIINSRIQYCMLYVGKTVDQNKSSANKTLYNAIPCFPNLPHKSNMEIKIKLYTQIHAQYQFQVCKSI